MLQKKFFQLLFVRNVGALIELDLCVFVKKNFNQTKCINIRITKYCAKSFANPSVPCGLTSQFPSSFFCNPDSIFIPLIVER